MIVYHDRTTSVVLGVLALLLLGAGLWYFWPTEENQTNEVNNERPIIANESDEVVDTSQWQVYRNERLNFEIKFPKTWHWKQDQGDKKEVNGNYQLFIGLAPTESLRDDAEQPYAIKLAVVDANVEFSYEGPFRELAVRDGKKFVLMGAAESAAEVNAMATTFWFLDEAREVLSWQTYRNEEVGFTMKLPQGWTVTTDYAPEGGAEGEIRIVPKLSPDEFPKPIFWLTKGQFANQNKDDVNLWTDGSYAHVYDLTKLSRMIKQSVSFMGAEQTIDTSDWQTYNNDVFKVTFKYPKDWEASVVDQNQILVSARTWRDGMPEGGGSIFIKKTDFTLSEFIADYNNLDGISKIENQTAVTFNGIPATKLKASTAIGLDQYFIFVTVNNLNYSITYHDFDPYHVAIVATLKFVDQVQASVDTSDWQTYKNEELGFEVEYPKEWYLTQLSENSLQPEAICISSYKLREDAGVNCDLSIVANVSTIEKELRENITNKESITFAEKPAFKINFIAEVNDTPTMSILVPIDKIVYVISYSSGNNNIKVIENIIDTFKFTK